MQLPVILCFMVGTVMEIYSLNWMSGEISILNTVSLIMLTFLVGIVVGRSWGKEFFQKMQWHLKSGTVPEKEILKGAVMAVASMALITPGVVTDALGLLILFPVTREIFLKLASGLTRKKIAAGEHYFFFKS